MGPEAEGNMPPVRARLLGGGDGPPLAKRRPEEGRRTSPSFRHAPAHNLLGISSFEFRKSFKHCFIGQ